MHQTNTNLFERAAELIDIFTDHPAGVDGQIIAALEANDLQEIYRLVNKYEAELAREQSYATGDMK